MTFALIQIAPTLFKTLILDLFRFLKNFSLYKANWKKVNAMKFYDNRSVSYIFDESANCLPLMSLKTDV